MKRIVLYCMLPCLLFGIAFGQSIQHIAPLPQSDVRPLEQFEYQGNWTNLYIPGQGVFNSQGVSLRMAATHPGPKDFQRIPTHLLPATAGLNAANREFQDARNLPLSPNGKLLSVDGYEVEFDWPTASEADGICGTPRPRVVIPPNAPPPANCPFVVPCDNPVNRDANIPNAGDPLKFIKINWTVILDGANDPNSNIDQTRVDDLMAELNADFLPFRIQFCADPATFVSDATHYNLNVGTEDGSLKTTYAVTPGNVMNAYVVGQMTNPSAGGYAYFPYSGFGGLNTRGGVVLGRGNMFIGTHTLAHEVGHTFGLEHTFHGVSEVTPCTNCYEGRDLASGASSGGDTEGDWCTDTNPHPQNSNICGDAGVDACAPNLPWLNSPVNNHMSYSFCTTQFTPQQAGRMHCMIDTYLQPWVGFGGGTCGNLPPTASFSCSPQFWQAPVAVTFTDNSVPNPIITNWRWNFDVDGIGGATPATFTGGPGVGDNPPVVNFDSCGYTYYIELIVESANGNDTIRDSCVTTICPANECDTLFSHWNTPASTPSIFTFAANDHVTGLPAPTLQGGPGVLPIGFYEQYFTPTPGVTTVGAVRAGLGDYLDPDSNMTIQVVIYNCDVAGTPVGPPIGGLAGINPGRDLGVPGGGFFFEFWIPFNKVTIDSANFLVGVEMFPGNPNDRLIVVSSANGQGQALGLNHALTAGFGYIIIKHWSDLTSTWI